MLDDYVNTLLKHMFDVSILMPKERTYQFSFNSNQFGWQTHVLFPHVNYGVQLIDVAIDRKIRISSYISSPIG